MVEAVALVVGALMFVGGGIVVVSPDHDIYPSARVFCTVVALIGLVLLCVAGLKVAHG